MNDPFSAPPSDLLGSAAVPHSKVEGLRVEDLAIKDDQVYETTPDRISRSSAELLLGRKLVRNPEGRDVLTTEEVLILGTAAGGLDAISEEEDDNRRIFLIQRLVEQARADHGEQEARRILAFLHREITTKIKKNKSDVQRLNTELVDLTQQKGAVVEFLDWLPLDTPKLQRPDGSAFHKVREACQKRALIPMTVREKQPERLADAFDGISHGFVIEHNWAAAFAGTTDFDGGEVRLPFPVMVVEFLVNGKRICVILEEHDHRTTALPLISFKAGWIMPGVYEYASGQMKARSPLNPPFDGQMQKVMDLIGANIRAISISLEAEIAETSIVRIPHKLNRARERRGKLPLFDYHVVSLAKRSRYLPRADLDPDREIVHKRCHFRHGHYRHFPTYKIYIKWMLVGDPDLGFVDKHYRL